MSVTREKLVAGNWKMNGNAELLKAFADGLQSPSDVTTVICPPTCYLSASVNADFKLGAQNISAHEKGAHTGEISTSMLNDLKIAYVIIGHSERRENHFESDSVVAEKVKAALNNGLTPILCVGESLEVRESGKVFEFVQAQLDAVVSLCGSEFIQKGVVAYEPIWAIGTGKTASPEQAQDVHAFIREHLAKSDEQAANKIPLLYGGSVNASNAKTLFEQADIDGGLVGGASLKLEDFITICQAAS